MQYNENPMEVSKIRLNHRKTIASGTTSFCFEKPASFVFKAGQYMDIGLIDPPETDNEGNVRTFSIASAPHETELMITTRMRDTAFKRVLGNLPDGSEVEMRGMGGSFTLHNKSERAAVFLAGGIGITPFRSMIVDALFRKLPHRIVLMNSNRAIEEAAFLNELTDLAASHPQFTFVPSTARIDAASIAAHSKDLVQPIYYVAGSMAMVSSMREILNGMGIDDDDVKSEDFPGY